MPPSKYSKKHTGVFPDHNDRANLPWGELVCQVSPISVKVIWELLKTINYTHFLFVDNVLLSVSIHVLLDQEVDKVTKKCDIVI